MFSINDIIFKRKKYKTVSRDLAYRLNIAGAETIMFLTGNGYNYEDGLYIQFMTAEEFEQEHEIVSEGVCPIEFVHPGTDAVLSPEFREHGG